MNLKQRIIDLGNKISGLEGGGVVDADLVHKTGNEEIGGVKDFLSSPLVPTPTTDLQVANKTYVDAAVEVVPTFLMRFWRPDYHIVDANVNVAADTITITGHRLATGTSGAWTQTWGGFTASVTIFVIRLDDDTVQFATTRANAETGVAMNISGLPGGTVTFTSSNGHHIFAGRPYKTTGQMTFEIDDTDVDAALNTINIPNHGFSTGHGIMSEDTWGTVTANTLYFAIKIDDNTISLATTFALSQAGTALDIADPGGTVTIYGCYGACYYDAFVTPQLGAEYVFSVGYGGAHIMLLGFNGGADGRIGITGNVRGLVAGVATNVGFTSGVVEAFIGKPLHIAVLIYNGVLIVFLNGVPCFRTAFTSGRIAADYSSDTQLFIAGSDHSNFEGDGYWVRVFENSVPMDYSSANGSCLRIANPRPRISFTDAFGGKHQRACLLHNYTQPSLVYQNLGTPLYNDGRTNEGTRSASTDFGYASDYASFEEYELPQQVRAELPSAPIYDEDVPSVPVGAVDYDSFTRNQDSVYVWKNQIGMGETEGGSQQGQWFYTAPENEPRHGILFNHAFVDGTGGDSYRAYRTYDTPYKRVQIRNCGTETPGLVLFAAYDFAANTGFKALHYVGDIIFYRIGGVGGDATLGVVTAPAGNTAYNLAIEFTEDEEVRLLINGVAEITSDQSGQGIVGESAGFTSSVGYCLAKFWHVTEAE